MHERQHRIKRATHLIPVRSIPSAQARQSPTSLVFSRPLVLALMVVYDDSDRGESSRRRQSRRNCETRRVLKETRRQMASSWRCSWIRTILMRCWTRPSTPSNETRQVAVATKMRRKRALPPARYALLGLTMVALASDLALSSRPFYRRMRRRLVLAMTRMQNAILTGSEFRRRRRHG